MCVGGVQAVHQCGTTTTIANGTTTVPTRYGKVLVVLPAGNVTTPV